MCHRRLRDVVLALCILAPALPLFAHAILLSATPAVSQGLRGPDIPVRLQFNSRIDVKRSRLLLVFPDGQQRTLQIGQQSSPNSLISEAKGLPRGPYILRWQVLASDGHISRGEVPFRID